MPKRSQKSEKIETIKNRFKHKQEWLLIRVDRMVPNSTVPISGRLLAHSPIREKIYKKSIKAKGLTLVDFSEDTLPKGYAVAF